MLSFPWSGKQGDWDWKDHCSMCSHDPPPHIQYVFSKWGFCMLAQHYEEVFTAVVVCPLRHRISFNSLGFSLQHLSSRGKSESLIWQYLITLITQGKRKTSTINHGYFKTINSSIFANSWGRKLFFPENTEADGSSVNARISLQILLTWNSFGQFRTSGVNMGEGNEKFLECI